MGVCEVEVWVCVRWRYGVCEVEVWVCVRWRYGCV